MNNELPVNQDFPVQFNEYAAFDALSLKTLMQDRLTVNGVFTDQIYEGSNFNNFLDVIAYSYNVLLYYLNQTGNEGLFSSSQIYENMNKIVKLINYKPHGPTTSVLTYNATANVNLPAGVYTIPRFSYFTINDTVYSYNKDLTFVKKESGAIENLSDLTDRSLLYQGEFVEYPLYVSTGEIFEEVSIVSVDGDGNNETIDHNNIYVFVRGSSGKWKEFKRVDSLFLHTGIEEVFEVRYNENQRYSIKFGNNVNGKKLIAGNLVGIYYLRSDKSQGEIGPGTLDNNQLFFFNTERLNVILNDTRERDLNIISLEQVNNITFTNTTASVPFKELETVKEIRSNAPNFFKRQGRLVTVKDFESFLKENFSNLIADVKVVNNWDYAKGHLGYLYDLGLDNPLSQDSRILYSQVNFADSCNFNNVYIYVVPKSLVSNDFTFERAFLNLGIKDYVLNYVNELKVSTVETVFIDPVYLSLDFGCASQNELFTGNLNLDLIKTSKFYIVKSNANNIGDNELKEKVKSVILNNFKFDKTSLGMTLDIDSLASQLYDIDGVESFYTSRDNIKIPGINLVAYNFAYSNAGEDISIINQTTKLPFFKIPLWSDPADIINKIEIVSSSYLEN